MPPKRARGKEAKPAAAKKPRAAAKKAGGWKMPPPLPAGEVLHGHDKSQWVLGSSIGTGGFGEIYLASPAGKSSPSGKHVIKIEPEENGPLFTELSFYRRPLAKEESIKQWVNAHKLKYLAIPRFVAAGCHARGKTSYRFLVMDRFGEDIEKKFCQAGRKFNVKTVCYLALRLLEALEYLHESEYVHADIKGSNLLTGCDPAHQHEVVLVDYGLAYRYMTGTVHKQYKEDPRTAHDGTIEFTSIDAHNGVAPSRRGDLEILGYCLLQWMCGVLPWEGRLEDKPYVAAQKLKYKTDVRGLMGACFHSTPVPPSLKEYMTTVYSLGYEQNPNYASLKKLFIRELTAAGLKDDSKGLDWIGSTRKRKSTDEAGSPAKKLRKSPRKKPSPPSPEAPPSPPPPEKKAATKRARKLSPEAPPPPPSPEKKAATKRARKPSPPSPPPPEKKAVTKRARKAKCSPRTTNKLPVVSYPKELGYGKAPTETKRKTKVKPAAEVVVIDSDSDFEATPKRKRAARRKLADNP